jgi:hypothetical protein
MFTKFELNEIYADAETETLDLGLCTSNAPFDATICIGPPVDDICIPFALSANSMIRTFDDVTVPDGTSSVKFPISDCSLIGDIRNTDAPTVTVPDSSPPAVLRYISEDDV